MRVDGEIELRQPREVPDRLQLTHFRQQRTRRAAQGWRQIGRGRNRCFVRPLIRRAATGTGILEYDLFSQLHGFSSGGERGVHRLAQCTDIAMDVGGSLGLRRAHE